MNRFQDFVNLYDSTRPACPQYAVDILLRYLGRRPAAVVDLGCGTGLSTLVWKDAAERVIGVEPSEGMMSRAAANAEGIHNIEFVQGFSDQTGLASGIADIVTCSQSFHWMEPVSTLREAHRLLKPGGIFAAYDCDWPPACSAAVERSYAALFKVVHRIERDDPAYSEAFVRYPKERHLENIRTSGHFQYAREIVFANTEPCDGDRYIRMALSQGSVQAILKRNPGLIEAELTAFREAVNGFFADQVLPVEFCYRMRLGFR